MRLKNEHDSGNKTLRGYYNIVAEFIKNDLTDGDLLNLGCGSEFNFEKFIYFKSQLKIDSSDIIIPENIESVPPFVNEYIVCDVEKKSNNIIKKYDVVTFFELIEHVDHTDELLINCKNLLKDDGLLIFSFPNLSSLYSRIELLLGYQPHILEVSNYRANFGQGIFGRFNNPRDIPLHHIRGISHSAMRDLVRYHGFEIVKIQGYDYRFPKIFSFFPSVAPINIFACRKIKKI